MKTILIVMGILYVVLFLLFMRGAGILNEDYDETMRKVLDEKK